MLPQADTYEELRAQFAWQVPRHYNIAEHACERWALSEPERLALIHLKADGSRRDYAYGELKDLSDRLARLMAERGVLRGDRVAIFLPQCPEAAIAHLAVYKLGAIAVPLFTLFQEEALAYRLADSGAKCLIAEAAGIARVEALTEPLPELNLLIATDAKPAGASSRVVDLYPALTETSSDFKRIDSLAEDPAVIIYTSGTTGQPKGALHAQRVLLGHLPGVEMPQDLFPQPGDLFWTPADWAWIGGLFDALLPSLAHGVPILAHRFAKFHAAAAFELMARFGVRNAFMPPTALKMMRAAGPSVVPKGLKLRSIGSGGETLGAELLDWGRQVFGVTINEFYGQTECNLLVANCATIMPVKPGSMGRPVPGHEVAVLGPDGRPLRAGEEGDIAVRRPDPAMFLHYWNKPEATAEKFRGDWLLTGDRGRMDEDGYLWFVGREDDVISSAGYRIGPAEIEDCLMRHPAVALCAVVGAPDPLRGQKVKAFVVPAEGVTPADALTKELQEHVKSRLAAHEYPREIVYRDSLPMTATGKIRRRDLREEEKP